MILGLAPATLALLLAVGLVGGFVRGLAGFGMAVLLVPIIALSLAPAEAVALGNLLGLLIGLPEFRRVLREAESSARTIAIIAVLATPLGLAAIAAIPVPLGRLLVAVIALGTFVAILLPQRPAHLPGRGTTAMVGLASGLLNGFAGMPGPPVAPYYLGRRIAPAVARASMMLIFLATSLAGCLAAWTMGLGSLRTAMLGLAMFPAVLFGNWLGTLCFGRVGPAVWRGFTGAILAAAFVGALVKLL